MRRLVVLCGSIVAAALMVGSFGAPDANAGEQAAVAEPVPSLTPVVTERLWSELVQRPRSQAMQAADCQPLRAVFYAATDWLRLTTRLAATASPCAQYYISVPPLAADKTQLRSDQAWRIRALGPAFHALAEINVTGWTAWVGSTGGTWYEAGVEARRRMAAAGYDVLAGDTWALNELSSAVRQGVGNARANMRAFLKGLYDGDGTLPVVRGTVFVAGIGQGTTDLSLYQARLQDWYEDSGFWTELSQYASDWSQELYGDIRHYAVAGTSRDTRRDSLNEYLQHQVSLAGVAPSAAAAARAFLGSTYSPLANAAWRYDASFGWTDVPVELMQDYVSAQTYATRSAANSRFGFAWSPRNLAELPAGDFTAQTDALLVRLAAAIADSAESAAAAGKTAATQMITVDAPPAETPPPTQPPAVSPPPTAAEPAGGTPTVVTPVAPPATGRTVPPPPTLRVVGAMPTRLTRRGSTAAMSIRFSLDRAARLRARVTPLGSTRVITLLPGTTLAGHRLTKVADTATATALHDGTYTLRVRLPARRLIRGRSYLVRLSAVDTRGRQRALTIRIRA